MSRSITTFLCALRANRSSMREFHSKAHHQSEDVVPVLWHELAQPVKCYSRQADGGFCAETRVAGTSKIVTMPVVAVALCLMPAQIKRSFIALLKRIACGQRRLNPPVTAASMLRMGGIRAFFWWSRRVVGVFVFEYCNATSMPPVAVHMITWVPLVLYTRYCRTCLGTL